MNDAAPWKVALAGAVAGVTVCAVVYKLAADVDEAETASSIRGDEADPSSSRAGSPGARRRTTVAGGHSFGAAGNRAPAAKKRSPTVGRKGILRTAATTIRSYVSGAPRKKRGGPADRQEASFTPMDTGTPCAATAAEHFGVLGNQTGPNGLEIDPSQVLNGGGYHRVGVSRYVCSQPVAAVY